MSSRAAPACVLLLSHFSRSLSAPLATAARNSEDDTGQIVLVAVIGCFALVLLCAWLSGNLECIEVRQILT